MKFISIFKFSPLFLFVCSVYSSESSDHALQKQSAATSSSSTDDFDSELTDNLVQEALAEGRTFFPPSQYRSVPFVKYRQSLSERYADDTRFQSAVRRLARTEDRSKEVDAFLGSLTQQDWMNFARPLVLDILREQISRIPKKQSLRELVEAFMFQKHRRHDYYSVSKEDAYKMFVNDERQALVEKMNALIEKQEYIAAQELEKQVLDDLKSVLDAHVQNLNRRRRPVEQNLVRGVPTAWVVPAFPDDEKIG